MENYGFHHLKLNLWQHDREKLESKLKHLEWIRQDKREPELLHDAIDLWIAHIVLANPRRKQEGVRKIEEIRERNSKHINSRADLCILYKEQGLKEAETIEEELRNLTQVRNNETEAIAIFEQAYVILFTEPENSKEAIIRKLKQSGDCIREELECMFRGRQRELKAALRNVSIATHYTSQARYHAEQAFKRETLKRYEACIEKLDKATELISERLTNELYYKYFIYFIYFKAFAYTRPYRIVVDNGCESLGSVEKEHLQQALFNCWEVIEKLDKSENESLRLYKGRMWAQLLSVIPLHKNLPEDFLDQFPEDIKKIVTDEKYADARCDEAIKFLKTDTEGHTDAVGATSLARFMMHLGKKTKNTDFNKKAKSYLEDARKTPAQCTWSLYSTCAGLNKTLGQKTCQDSEKLKYFEMAHADGVQCLTTKRTLRDLSDTAYTCYCLCKMQHITKQKQKYLKEAIMYLNEALPYGGHKDYYTNFYMGQRQYEKREKRFAIEWMKKAMQLADHRKVNCMRNGFYYPYSYLLEVLEEHKTLGIPAEDKNYIYFEFRELIYLGLLCFNSVHKELTYVFKGEKNSNYVEEFTGFIIKNPFKDETHQKAVLSCMLQLLEKVSPEVGSKLESLSKQSPEHFQHEKDGRETFSFSDFKLPLHGMKGTERQRKYRYHFFICHSEVNAGWVREILLKSLEMKLYETDVQLSGCIADRDFIPGESIIQNTVRAIEESNKIILVLSPEFKTCRWRDFETDQALLKYLQYGRECIVPVILEECEIPPAIQSFLSYDMTDRNRQEDELRRLKFSIIPEDIDED